MRTLRPRSTSVGIAPPTPPPSPVPAVGASADAATAPPEASTESSAPTRTPSAPSSGTVRSAAATSATGAPTTKPVIACGDKPLPPCPLYAWMKANMSGPMNGQDFGELATAFDKAVLMAPAGYPNWASIARDGGSGARGQSLEAVKSACRGCHNQYKDKYKREMRARSIRARPGCGIACQQDGGGKACAGSARSR